MDSELLFVMLLLIFMAIIAYVFLNCNCRCNIQEGFPNDKMTLFNKILQANKNNCTCENGVAENSNYGIGSQLCKGKPYDYLIGNNDLCSGICNSDDYVDTGYNQDDGGKYFRKCMPKRNKTPYKKIDNKIIYYTDVYSTKKYDGYYPSGRYTFLRSNNAKDSMEICNDMNYNNEGSCGAIYEYHQEDSSDRKYYYAFSKKDEYNAQNSISINEDNNQIVSYNNNNKIKPHHNMKSKYVRT